MRFYEAHVIFETSFDLNGWNFLLIYGKHANGYFCCFPGWGAGSEMAEPCDTYYNTEKLKLCPVKEIRDNAKGIARKILEISKSLNTLE